MQRTWRIYTRSLIVSILLTACCQQYIVCTRDCNERASKRHILWHETFKWVLWFVGIICDTRVELVGLGTDYSSLVTLRGDAGMQSYVCMYVRTFVAVQGTIGYNSLLPFMVI